MRNNLYIPALLLFCLSGCIKDNSIIKLKELDHVQIEGIQEKYAVSVDDILTISPVIDKKSQNEADYDYVWYTYTQTTQHAADTIARTKDLNTAVSLAPGEYSLVLKVTDKNTGIFYKALTSLQVINDYTPGLMILSQNDEQASLAFYNTVSGKFIEDIFPKSNEGEVLGSNPVGIYYYAQRGTMPSEVLILCADQRGGVVADPVTFTKLRDIRNSFVIPIEESGTLHVEGFIARSTSGLQDYLMIDGQAHNRSANAGEVLFRPPLLGGNYYFAPVNMNSGSAPVFFDKLNGRFMTQPNTRAELSTFTNKQFPEIINPDEVDMNLLFAANVSGATFFTLFEDRVNGKRYILKFLGSGASLTFRALEQYEIQATRIMEAAAFAGGTTFQDYLFYAIDNQVYVFNVATKEGDLLMELDAQVSINFMKLSNNDLLVGYTNATLPGKQGSFASFAINRIGGISAIQTLKTEGFCDKIIDITPKN